MEEETPQNVDQKVTDFDKYCYNTYIKVSRSMQKQPYKYRENFTDIDDKTFIHIKKLSSLIARNKIDIETYIKAPYIMYPDEKFYIDFYLTPKAIKTYSQYLKMIDSLDPDSDEQKQFIKNSFIFINQYCKDNNITFQQYITSMDGLVRLPLSHFKQHKISGYVLISINGIDMLNSIEKDHQILMFGSDILPNLYTNQTKLQHSKIKVLIDTIIKELLKR